MSQIGIDISSTIEAWAEITMKVLFQRMDVFGWEDEAKHLRNSLENGKLSLKGLGDDKYNLVMEFNLYGRFVDMGVGKELYRGNQGDVVTDRQPKYWLSRHWWAQLQRLKEIMKGKYADASTAVVMEQLSSIMGTNKTSKGFYYAVSQSKRNARNYARRRSLPGKWTNNHKTWKPN